MLEYSKQTPPEWFDISRYSDIHKYSNTALLTNLEIRANLFDLILSGLVYDDDQIEFKKWYKEICYKLLESPIILNTRNFRSAEFEDLINQIYRTASQSSWLSDEDYTYLPHLTNTFISSLTYQDIDELNMVKSEILSLNSTGLISQLHEHKLIFDIEKAKYLRSVEKILFQPENLYIKIDISASKSKLLEQFEGWVVEAKKTFSLQADKPEVREGYFSRIRDNNLLAYLDLCLWMIIENTLIEDRYIADWITPLDKESTIILSRHKGLAHSSLNIHFIKALEKLDSDS